MEIIEVPQPSAVIYHEEGKPYQVLLNDKDGKRQATVTFDAEEGLSRELAYDYFHFQEQD
jgi:hypothetical protein